MTAKENTVLEQLQKDIADIKILMSELKLGIYGNKANNMIGLIEKTNIQDEKIEYHDDQIQKLRNFQWKVSAIFGFAGGLLGTILVWILNYVIK